MPRRPPRPPLEGGAGTTLDSSPRPWKPGAALAWLRERNPEFLTQLRLYVGQDGRGVTDLELDRWLRQRMVYAPSAPGDGMMAPAIELVRNGYVDAVAGAFTASLTASRRHAMELEHRRGTALRACVGHLAEALSPAVVATPLTTLEEMLQTELALLDQLGKNLSGACDRLRDELGELLPAGAVVSSAADR